MSDLLQITPQKSKIHRFLNYIKTGDDQFIDDVYNDETGDKLGFVRTPSILRGEDSIYFHFCKANFLIERKPGYDDFNEGFSFLRGEFPYKLSNNGELFLLRYKGGIGKIEMLREDYPGATTIFLSLFSGIAGVVIGTFLS